MWRYFVPEAISGTKMPRNSQKRVTGIWEKVPGRGVWWILYRVNGQLKREQVGRKSDAIALYQQRKSDVRAGRKLSSNLRSAGIRFKELASAIPTYSALHHRDTKNIRIRLARISAEFNEREADKVKPEENRCMADRELQDPSQCESLQSSLQLGLPRSPAQWKGIWHSGTPGQAAP